jgi:serpin B
MQTSNRRIPAAPAARQFVALTVLCLLCSEIRAALPAEQQALASANVTFAFRLLNQLASEQPGTNIFISPLGAASVLHMVANGAAARTQTEMQQVLGTAGIQQGAVNRSWRALRESLNPAGTNIILTAANAIWYRKGTPIRPEFITCNQQFFGAAVEPLDFDDPRSINTMNTWASEKTKGKISGIADGLINPLTQLFLANAVYFKGKWLEPFDVSRTKDRPFHLSATGQRKIPMMEQTRKFMYRRGSGYQSVRLEYQGWSLGMFVFLPDPDSSPQKLLSIMSGDKWQRVTRPGFTERQGTVVLPRFKMQYGVELKQPLMALGLRAAFGKADFPGISEHSLFISAIRQQAFVEVNEDGTEAAAATGLAAEQSDPEMNPPKPFEMIVDRPFLFLIEDSNSGTVLFMGVMFNPAPS